MYECETEIGYYEEVLRHESGSDCSKVVGTIVHNYNVVPTTSDQRSSSNICTQPLSEEQLRQLEICTPNAHNIWSLIADGFLIHSFWIRRDETDERESTSSHLVFIETFESVHPKPSGLSQLQSDVDTTSSCSYASLNNVSAFESALKRLREANPRKRGLLVMSIVIIVILLILGAFWLVFHIINSGSNQEPTESPPPVATQLVAIVRTSAWLKRQPSRDTEKMAENSLEDRPSTAGLMLEVNGVNQIMHSKQIPGNFGFNATVSYPEMAVCDGKMYESGGLYDDGFVCDLFVHDMHSNGTGFFTKLHTCRNRHSMHCLNDTRLLVCGGMTEALHDASCEMCDILSESCAPYSTMPLSVSSHKAVKITESRILIIGGISRSTDLDTIYHFDIDDKRWTLLTRMPAALCEKPGVVLLGTSLLICGGNYNNTDSTFCHQFDLMNNTWTAFPSLNVGRSNLALISVGNNLFAIGGSNSDNGILESIEIFSKERNKWELTEHKLSKGLNAYNALLLSAEQSLNATLTNETDKNA